MPVERERPLAKCEAVEVPRNSARQFLELFGEGRIDPYLESVFLRVGPGERVARPFCAPCVLGKYGGSVAWG